MVDNTRFDDLEEIAGALDNAKSRFEKDRLEKLAYKIMHESAPIVSLRQELVKAFRARDIHRVKQIQGHIHRVKQDETYGHSTGGYKEINNYE
jgi:hypothetical protein